MRVFAGSLLTETNSFSPLPTTIDSFRATYFADASAPPDPDDLHDRPVARAKVFYEARGAEFVTTLRTAAQPSGPVDGETWRKLRDAILADLAAALPVDIVVMGLHGAMIAVGEDDCEGALLARMRVLAGPRATIGAWLDPHAHLTGRMRDAADILAFYKEYPHTDIEETADQVVALCWRTARGEVRPTSAVGDPRLIKTWPTHREPIRSFVARMRRLEEDGSALSVSLVHGFPWGDSPDLGTKLFVTTDGDPVGAQRLADDLAEEIAGYRDGEDYDLVAIDDAIDAALAEDRGPVVLADLADNPGGGAAQDSTFILKRLVARGVEEAALGALFDPRAVELCVAAGVGADLALSIGGHHGPQSGTPLDATAHVVAIGRPLMQTVVGGKAQVSVGDAAWVKVGNVDVILSSRREQTYSTDLFSNIGIDPLARRILVVKSSNHFHASFSGIASRIVYVATPGTLNTDLRTLPYRKAPRTLWPLDLS